MIVSICFSLFLLYCSPAFAEGRGFLKENIKESQSQQTSGNIQKNQNSHLQFIEGGFELELISQYIQVKKESDFLVGLRIKIPKGWHSYWSFAGDFGQAPKVQWKQIRNVRIESLPFPVPERKKVSINEQESYSFIYEKELFIPFKVLIEEDYDKDHLPLSMNLQWFVCKDICLSKENQLELNLKLRNIFEENKKAQPAFYFWDSFFPKEIDLQSYFQVKDKKLIVHFSFEEEIQCRDLFPKKKEDFSTTPPVLLSQNVNSCIFQVNRSSSDLPKISGLLLYSKGGQSQSAEFSSYRHKNLALLWFAFLAFLGGLILNVMPCVLPVIFLKMYNTLEWKHLPARKILLLNLSYVFGIIISFLCLAFIIFISKQTGESLGWGFHLQSPAFVTFLSLLFTLMAFYLLNVVSFSVPKVQLFFKDEKIVSHFMTGVLSTTAASPCTVPFMTSAVGFAFSRSSLEIFVIFFFLGLGLSFPYLVLSFFPKALKHIPSPGRWTEVLKKILSIPLFLTVLWLLWILYLQVEFKLFLFSLGVFPLLLLWLFLQKAFQKAITGKILNFIFICLVIGFFVLQQSVHSSFQKDNVIQNKKSSNQGLNWTIFHQDKLLFDKQAGKNIFLAFGAEWCLTCKLNERIFETLEFKQLVKDRGLALYYGDWTAKNNEITKFLQSYGQQGVPFYVFFKGEEKAFIFPTLLFKESFFQKLKELSNYTDPI